MDIDTYRQLQAQASRQSRRSEDADDLVQDVRDPGCGEGRVGAG